jgi:hypothetical protein
VKIENLIAQISTQHNRQYTVDKKTREMSPEEMIKSENTRKLRHLFEAETQAQAQSSQPSLSKKEELANSTNARKHRSSSVV